MATPRRRQIYIEVENNGFKIVTRSGSWVKATKEALMREVSDYIEVIRKEMRGDVQPQTGGQKQ